MKNQKELYGAIVVLKNYLDGAVADYEEGVIDNTEMIEECIEALEVLSPYYRLVNEYRERFDKIRKEGN